ncbi:NAD(P)/FAD-dependent oxidoreductase [Pseudochrobactrum sp. MP213Fo]|uniref:NAD(P)/FAD-dependent oxidoreductase n=1 Tax=Pseudochrobactrum sp. MP213Fo TaxID=3022250 RepID=UPI003B9DE62D
MRNSIFTDNFREANFWTEDQPKTLFNTSDLLPKSADIVVIGSGLTGTSAAYELAKSGRSVIVLDQGEIGGGASSRNAGMLGKGNRQSYLLLKKAAGQTVADNYFGELERIYREATDRITGENFQCDYRPSGRFIGSLRPDFLGRLLKEYEARATYLGEKVTLLDHNTAFSTGSQQFYGGVIVEDSAAINPAKYTAAMVTRAAQAGAQFFSHVRVTGTVREKDGHHVHTPHGTIFCKNVVMATNGYSGSEMPFAYQRLLPINAYMIATEELPADLLARLCPNNRTTIDNSRATRYFQISPDGKRLIFGARSGRKPLPALSGSLQRVARAIHSDMSYLFPELAETKISHVWTGRCAASLDLVPHLGVNNGIHYAIGYSFTGLALAPYLGRLAARWILDDKVPDSVFAQGEFPKLPSYARALRPLSGPVVTRYYAWQDRPVPRA